MIRQNKNIIISVSIGLVFFAILAIVINQRTPRVEVVQPTSDWTIPVLASTTPTKSIAPEGGQWNDMPTPPQIPTMPGHLLPQTPTPTTTPSPTP